VRGQRHGPILKHGAVRGSPSKAVSGGKNGGGGSASVVGGTTTCTGCNGGLSGQAEEKEFQEIDRKWELTGGTMHGEKMASWSSCRLVKG
jgi:hypothetical protein